MTPLNVLPAEDKKGEIILIRETLKDGKLKNKISIVRNREQAIQFLNKETGHPHTKRSGLILQDINYSRIDGKEVLIYLKTNPPLKAIPEVMLLTPCSEKDVPEPHKNHINCYIPKRVDLDKFFEAVQKIEKFRMPIEHLPKTD
jgi:CheY-like chemotaxis protein